ncbi:MAG: diacylglycerol/lipid kinase family protein [Eubacteriales bacterium]
MATKILLLVNPVSGDGIAKQWISDMVSVLSKKYDLVTVYLSKGVGDITKTVSEYAGEYDAVACVGGDGSLNEAISGVLLSGAPVSLGYIPTGTINDFATSHGIPKNIRAAIEKIVSGKAVPCDVGMLNGKFFAYVAAFGAFTDVAYLTSQKSKEAFGKIAYVAEAANRISELKPIKMSYEMNGEKITGEYIYGMASNSKTVGGIRFFDSEREDFLSDGEFEITLVKYPFNPTELANAVMGLINPAMNTPQIVKFKSKSIVFEFEEETTFTVDGEFGGKFARAELKNFEKAISVIE